VSPLDLLHSPRVLRRIHGVLTLVWMALIVPTLIWWRESVLWVALMSIWANIASHWAAWQASRAETKVDRKED
jgi:hypothetical protein